MHSIRRALILRLAGPLVLLTLAAGAASYGVARHFSDGVLDQWLYDTAVSLANRVQWKEGGASIDLPEGAREMLEWDLVDRVFYEVVSAEGRHIGGNARLPPPPQPLASAGAKQFYNGTVDGEPVRVLALERWPEDGQTVVVKIAETQQKRSALARQVLWISLALSLVLAALSAGLIWFGIGRGLGSIERAVRSVRSRDPTSRLTPIAIAPDTPVEVVPLVDEINALMRELDGAHRVTERFIVNAAHQLRTPLATLRVQLEAAVRERDGQRRAAHVNDAVQVAAHMSRVLQQLLTLAKADEKASRGARSGFADLDRIARELVERRLDEAVARGIDLGYDGPGEPVVVEGNDDLLREALANLIDNALRHGGAGGHVTVGVAPSPPGVYVEDRGPGIPVDERPRVADRFYRIPGTAAAGSGLGLSIVHEIAQLYGATLVLESGADGRGLRASLRFAGPAVRAAPASLRATDDAPVERAEAGALAGDASVPRAATTAALEPHDGERR
jgi:two-component system sensor histidine kinase TctE